MAGSNKGLHDAGKAKKDEFYTQLDDIAKELKHYKEHFRGKTVFCNCDDPYESNFFKYFALNFNAFGLKKLIATCYDGSPIAGGELPFVFKVTNEGEAQKIAYKVEITKLTDVNGDGATDLQDVKEILRNNPPVLLKENGDFRSAECVELLKQSDIVVTNPPFSLFREYVAQLIKYDKKFLVIGNINAITYKEIFKLIKENKAWLGTGMGRAISGFIVPKSYELYGTEARINEHGERIVATNNCLWLTNIDHNKRHEDLDLYKKYTPEEYPKYDNYEAINVNKTADIPMDYNGVMGVPITFLDKYNPEQFEIIDINPHFFSIIEKGLPKPKQLTLKNAGGKDPYARILIKRKK